MIDQVERTPIIGASDASLTPNAGLAAVSELVEHLNVTAALDAGIGPLKQRDRGINGGELLVSLALTAVEEAFRQLAALDSAALRAAFNSREVRHIAPPD